MYIVVRADLSPGLQASQAAHAAQEFMFIHPKMAALWRNRSNTIAIVAVRNVDELETVCRKAERQNIPCVRFLDPDLNPQFTAATIGPGSDAGKLCKRLPLALR